MANIICEICGITRDQDLATQIGDDWFCSPTCISAYRLDKSIRADTSTVTKVGSSQTNVMLAEAHEDRKMLTIYNDSTSALFVKYGTTATANSFSLKIGAGDYLEMPYPCYVGRIDGFWESVNGAAMITDID